MLKNINDEQLQCTLTVREVRSILNKYGVPYNEFAMRAMLRQAKQHRVKRLLCKCWKYAKALAKAAWTAIFKKDHSGGKYDKGGGQHGRKDM